MKEMTFNLDGFATTLFTMDNTQLKERPLTNEEWIEVERVLKIHGYNGPASLFTLEKEDMIEKLNLDDFVVYKISNRIRTMNEVIKILYQYELQDIHIITKYDDEYPRVLIKKMRRKAPNVLYAVGKMPEYFRGISLMGLQTVKKRDRQYIKQFVDKISDENKWLICCDNKGVDQVAMQYALNKKCDVICFVCDQIESKSLINKRHIKNGNLVYLSAVEPNIHFDVTNALDRNSYVCGLSDYHIIISSKINSGNTWFTAMHNMHNHWTNTLVLENDYPGNVRLMEMKTTAVKPIHIVSDLTFDEIFEMNNRSNEQKLIDIDQMSIFEFIGENDED